MRHISQTSMMTLAMTVTFVAGCMDPIPPRLDASAPGIRTAMELGGPIVRQASPHLQLANAEQENAKRVATNDEKERAAPMLLRAEPDQRVSDAQAALAKLATVKDEPRGMVITLSGGVLFASNREVLLPEARTRLEQVAEVLLTNRERNLTVEGHTDSQGSQSHNRDLSQRRAEAVRRYLMGRGYQGDLIQAHGLGKESPVADNATAEGRANNRRIEIVIAREPHASNPQDAIRNHPRLCTM
jgi:outer membrane protein OmpA-like peptidoglycan-associated protein